MSDQISVKEMTNSETFLVRNGADWGFFLTNESIGLVSFYTSYLNGSYSWNSRGNRTLKEFICELDFDYLMGKIVGRNDCLDIQRTVKVMLKDVGELMREYGLSLEKAREYCLEIRNFRNTCNEHEFSRELERSDYFCCENEVYYHMCYGWSPETKMFWDRMWQPFVSFLQENKIGELNGDLE